MAPCSSWTPKLSHFVELRGMVTQPAWSAGIWGRDCRETNYRDIAMCWERWGVLQSVICVAVCYSVVQMKILKSHCNTLQYQNFYLYLLVMVRVAPFVYIQVYTYIFTCRNHRVSDQPVEVDLCTCPTSAFRVGRVIWVLSIVIIPFTPFPLFSCSFWRPRTDSLARWVSSRVNPQSFQSQESLLGSYYSLVCTRGKITYSMCYDRSNISSNHTGKFHILKSTPSTNCIDTRVIHRRYTYHLQHILCRHILMIYFWRSNLA